MTQKVYSFGSNLFGQLGVHKTTGLPYHLHPITKQKLYYAVQPIEVGHFNDQSQADSLFVQEVACGDCFSFAVTTAGEVYSWGLATHGQLGVPIRKGMMSNMIDQDGILFSRAIQKVKGIEPIEHLSVSGRHVYARTRIGQYYFWGFN